MLEFAEAQYADRETLFVEVILPLAIAKNYTYRVPYEMNNAVAVGKRAVVQFGKSKLYTAIIASIGKLAPEKYQAKYIIEILDDRPVVTGEQPAVLAVDVGILYVHFGRGNERCVTIGIKAG